MVAAAMMWALCGSAMAAQTSYGWIEKGVLMPYGVAVKMKLDTGALTSSLDARDLKHFKKDGKPWVRFNLVLTDANTDKVVRRSVERPVERSVTVRGAGGMEQRPTVTMSVCVGDQVYKEWFANSTSKCDTRLCRLTVLFEYLDRLPESETFPRS
ncbi:ATP-dependent zinc protease family protein [Aeromonas sp. WP2-W18-CRE-05]|uniref:ATP-dependent zinc protease family protein n=1 Tax=Aeromonas sp. WP2-W18-CRE-05 TaxID=2675707 RepID=UPI001E440C69|nr:RimK/LysX family protein [Aeromonas sp. WP2-W18-CRE-05]